MPPARGAADADTAVIAARTIANAAFPSCVAFVIFHPFGPTANPVRARFLLEAATAVNKHIVDYREAANGPGRLLLPAWLGSSPYAIAPRRPKKPPFI